MNAQCQGEPVEPGAGLLELTFDDAASIESWEAVADATPEAVPG